MVESVNMEEQILEEEMENTQKDRFLTFSIDGESYGLVIKHVTEIIGIQGVTQIPNQPEYVRGVINLRGKIIPTMDIRLRFSKEEREYDDRTCIIVLEIEDIDVGIIVDRVLEVVNIGEERISPPPHFVDGGENKFIQGIGELESKVVLLLNSHTFLTDAQFEAIGSLELET